MTGCVKFPIIDGTRECTKCHEVKGVDHFYYKNGKGYKPERPSDIMSECKDCFRGRVKRARSESLAAA